MQVHVGGLEWQHHEFTVACGYPVCHQPTKYLCQQLRLGWQQCADKGKREEGSGPIREGEGSPCVPIREGGGPPCVPIREGEGPPCVPIREWEGPTLCAHQGGGGDTLFAMMSCAGVQIPVEVRTGNCSTLLLAVDPVWCRASTAHRVVMLTCRRTAVG